MIPGTVATDHTLRIVQKHQGAIKVPIGDLILSLSDTAIAVRINGSRFDLEDCSLAGLTS